MCCCLCVASNFIMPHEHKLHLIIAARGRYSQLRAMAGFTLTNVTAGQQFDESSYSLKQEYMWCVIGSVLQSNSNWKCLARTVCFFSSDIKNVKRKWKKLLSKEKVEWYLLQGCCKLLQLSCDFGCLDSTLIFFYYHDLVTLVIKVFFYFQPWNMLHKWFHFTCHVLTTAELYVLLHPVQPSRLTTRYSLVHTHTHAKSINKIIKRHSNRQT